MDLDQRGSPMRDGPLVLLTRVGSRTLAAIPANAVVETMRPLPCEPVSGAPGFVRGVSIIRGDVTAVIDLADLVALPADTTVARYVTVRTGGRTVALAVSDVVGLRTIEAPVLAELPPLLRPSSEAIEAIGTLDGELLCMLQETWRIPEELWAVLDADQEGRP